jgi:predicted aspartyl protease
MYVRRALGVLTLAAAGLLPQLAHAELEPPCKPDRLASLDITYDSTGRPTVPVKIEGYSKKFLVDTGATFGMLNWQTVYALNLPKKNLPVHIFYMLNGASMEYESMAHDVELGGIPIEKQPFLVMPAHWSDNETAGTIAPDTLAHYDVDFDFGGGKINLIAPNDCDGNVVTWTHKPHVTLPLRVDMDGKMHITADLDGTSVDAIIDTGSAWSVLREDVAGAVLGRGLGGSEVLRIGTGDNNGWNAYHHKFRMLSIGGIESHNPDLVIMSDKLVQVQEPDEINKGFRIVGMQAPPLIIGMDVLRQLHLYVDYRDNVVYATAADAR